VFLFVFVFFGVLVFVGGCLFFLFFCLFFVFGGFWWCGFCDGVFVVFAMGGFCWVLGVLCGVLCGGWVSWLLFGLVGLVGFFFCVAFGGVGGYGCWGLGSSCLWWVFWLWCCVDCVLVGVWVVGGGFCLGGGWFRVLGRFLFSVALVVGFCFGWLYCFFWVVFCSCFCCGVVVVPCVFCGFLCLFWFGWLFGFLWGSFFLVGFFGGLWWVV